MVVLVETVIGKRYIGELVEQIESVVTLNKPLLLVEGIEKQKDGSQAPVSRLIPISGMVNATETQIKWSAVFPIEDEKFVAWYDKLYNEYADGFKSVEFGAQKNNS